MKSQILAAVLMMATYAVAQDMQVLYGWTHVDYTFPSDAAREAMLRSGKFIPKNNIIIDVDYWEGVTSNGRPQKKMFVTMPKLKKGIPVTLATVTDTVRGNTTLLAPYPDWGWHRSQLDCDGIISVFRTYIDPCGRLWVLDSGTTDIFTEKPNRICRPKILVFNLQNDKLIGRYRFPESVLDEDSLLITIVVDTRDNKCRNTFAYIADVVGFKLIVFDAQREMSWRIASNLFYPYPLQGEFNINGVSFNLMDGIFGLALGPYFGGDRRLYFHSLASVRESWVSTCIIRNQSLFENDANSSPRSFHVSEGERSSQSGAQAMSADGILFFGLMSDNSIGCWNSRLPYISENLDIAAHDDVTLQFASGVKVYGDNIFVLTSRLQNYIVGDVKENEINYRINAAKVSDLVRGTKCQVRADPFTPSGSSYGAFRPFTFGS